MTPCEKLGYKVGDRFECIEGNPLTNRNIGDILVLKEDDGSYIPLFKNETTGNEILHVGLSFVRKITQNIKTGDTIERDGKKYRMTLDEIPQYDFKPGMVCQIDWGKADASCVMHSDCMSVVFMGNSSLGRGQITYATINGFLAIGFVNTSSLRPE